MRKRLRYVCIFFAAATLAACGATTAQKPASTEASPPAQQPAKPKPKTPPKPASLHALVAKVRSGVIRVQVDTCDAQYEGTGFLLSPRLVATVQHVVDGAVTIRLIRSGRVLGTATVIGSDSVRDLALLRTALRVRGYDFALEKRAPELGEDVAVLGFPLGLPLSVSRGLVSGADRTIPIEGIKRRRLVQTDAAVNHGNSGGPLISLETGKVVGLVDIGTTQANGLAFAVSSQVARPLLSAWAVSPQPLSVPRCGLEPQSNQQVTETQVAPPPAPDDAAAVKATISEHWSLIRQQRYEEAYDLFSPRFKSQVSREGWVNDKLRDRPKVSAIVYTSAMSFAGDTADVNVGFTTVGRETTSTNTGCNVWNGSYHVVRQGSTWLIDDSHLSREPC